MAFSEFYCNASTGSNMNGGSDENASPSYSATNGGFNSGTGVFTPTSGDPSASVTVGQFAHVFTDGSTTPTFIGRVTAVNSTTVTVSTTAKSGTAPGTAATGISINVGGVWKGPNGTEEFPFGFITASPTNASGDGPRVNLKNNAQYDITASMVHNVSGSVVFQGYSATPGDLGKATIDGGTSGASYSILNNAGSSDSLFVDLIFCNNGATGNAAGVSITGATGLFRCVVHSVRGDGYTFSVNGLVVVECEAYSCNQSSGSWSGFRCSNAATLIRCTSHDNGNSNGRGFALTGGNCALIACIADSNAEDGINASARSTIIGCDCYNNGGDGIDLASATVATVQNCNLVKNGNYGIRGAAALRGAIYNCGFGAGTQANSSGTTTAVGGVFESGSVTYTNDVTPWTDPANGDFRISLAAAKNAGRGAFTQTASSYTGAVGYPDIGAAVHQDSGGAATPYVIGS